MSGFHLETLAAESGTIAVCHAQGAGPLLDFATEHRAAIDAALSAHGALLFRGFEVASLQTFDAVTQALSERQLDYMYRSTPRTAATGRVFTASEYPPDQHIPLHNENAYQREWPLRLAFLCRTPAVEGGQTPLADMRRVTAATPPDLMAKFTELGVEYRRNYSAYMDLPWQTVFQTSDREVVEAYCRRHDLAFAWRRDGGLTTTQRCHGTARHPVTGEEVLFNQAHLFHVSSVGEEAARIFVESFGLDGVPRHARFGDGSEISASELDVVRRAYSEAAVSFEWRAHDVLLLDNMRMAHGRRPFKGPREVFAVLMDAHAPEPAVLDRGAALVQDAE